MKFYEVKVLSYSIGNRYYVDEFDVDANFEFIKATAKLKDNEYVKIDNAEDAEKLNRELQSSVRKQTYKEQTYNENHKNEYMIYYTSLETESLTLCVAAKIDIDFNKVIREYLNIFGVKVLSFVLKEITIRELCSCLENRFGSMYRSSGLDAIVNQLGLGFHYSRFKDGYGENTINGDKKQQVYKAAKELATYKNLREELDRVYASKPIIKNSHPVHYVLYTQNRDVRRETYRTLLEALYHQERIENKRYCYVDINAITVSTIKNRIDDFYKSNFGGCIVVRLDQYDDDDEFGFPATDSLEIFAKYAKLYQHNVLTIFCLPMYDEIAKNILEQNLGGITLVEIKESTFDYNSSKQYLSRLAKKEKFNIDKTLYLKLEKDKEYTAEDLSVYYQEWKNKVLKKDCYPQYEQVQAIEEKTRKEAPSGEAYAELERLIGLDSAKKTIKQIISYGKMRNFYRGFDIKAEMPALNMAFLGNPGTAKTTVARLLGKILYENGIIEKNIVVETGRGDLIAKYVGQTAPLVQSAYKKAEGGILFIDEAYSLVDDRRGMYGDEAINTIVQEMENRRNSVITIFAGYPKEMKEFIARNPGLKSRIGFIVNFDDYSEDELCEISMLIAKDQGLTINASGLTKLKEIYKGIKGEDCFGNGRYARTMIEQARMRQAQRITALNPDEINKEVVTTLIDEDFESNVELESAKKVKIGF